MTRLGRGPTLIIFREIIESVVDPTEDLFVLIEEQGIRDEEERIRKLEQRN
jgi:hypothetical protein